ncbi:lactate utilization protein C [Gordonia sp. SID5947]|uniref:LutC/YkgG family protein n=1 Tax=Gordonia sp. SID5947 TaxID=2690315 RepID=UPI001370EA42|nr:LUD domain-containing protein [Gordonia sp. SID5947]MYR06668.1 lactate utilization protein C [Gordonia sp. SID5947]
MSAREEILGRIRNALDDVHDPRVEETPVDWAYGRPVSTGDLGLVDRFAERVADYRATVEQVSADDLGAAVAAALSEVDGPIIADELVRIRLDVELNWMNDDDLSPTDLDAVGAVVTTVAVGIANTGTIVLDHGAGQGRRAVSLVPDVHLCVVEADQVVTDVPEAVARLVETGAQARPQTWISGPSATSDIELDRVEGVHGPRNLHVLIVR